MNDDKIVVMTPTNSCMTQNKGYVIISISASFCSSNESPLNAARHILNTINPSRVKRNNNPRIVTRVLHSNCAESVNKLGFRPFLISIT